MVLFRQYAAVVYVVSGNFMTGNGLGRFLTILLHVVAWFDDERLTHALLLPRWCLIRHAMLVTRSIEVFGMETAGGNWLYCSYSFSQDR